MKGNILMQSWWWSTNSDAVTMVVSWSCFCFLYPYFCMSVYARRFCLKLCILYQCFHKTVRSTRLLLFMCESRRWHERRDRMGERAGACVCVGGRGVRARRDSWMRRQIEIPPPILYPFPLTSPVYLPTSHSVPLPCILPGPPIYLPPF